MPTYLKLSVLLIAIALTVSCRSSGSTSIPETPEEPTATSTTTTPTATPVQDTPTASPEETAEPDTSEILEGTEYLNPQFPYGVLQPKGWELTESGDHQSVEFASREFLGVLRVNVIPSLLTTMPLEDFVDQHLAAIGRVSEIEVLVGPALTTHEDNPSVIVAYAYGGAALPFEEVATFVSHLDNGYLITITRSRGLEDAGITTEQVQYLMGTFHFLIEE